jgi:hypothetical protein
MALNIREFDREVGYFRLYDESGNYCGSGRMHPSESVPGFVNLYFSASAIVNLWKGLRLPAEWTNEDILSLIESSKPTK